mgnify:CR=1 FL=1
MSADLLAILVSTVLVVLAISYGALGWQRRRSWRVLLVGSGMALAVAGLWLGGVINLIINGVRSLVTWWGRQIWDARMLAALGLLIVGVIAFGVGHAFARTPARLTGQPRRAGTEPSTPAKAIKSAGAPAAGSSGLPHASPRPDVASADEDAEIEAILRKRGI